MTTQTDVTTLPNRPLVIDEAAEYLRMSVDTMRAYRRQGKGPKAREIAGRLVYRIHDLDHWLDTQPTS